MKMTKQTTLQTSMLGALVSFHKPMNEWTPEDNAASDAAVLAAKAAGKVAEIPWPQVPGEVVNAFVSDGEVIFTIRRMDGQLVDRSTKFVRALTVEQAAALGWKTCDIKWCDGQHGPIRSEE